jgi:hypothetical protein
MRSSCSGSVVGDSVRWCQRRHAGHLAPARAGSVPGDLHFARFSGAVREAAGGVFAEVSCYI